MQFVFNTRSARKLARSLEKFLLGRGFELVHGQALDALAVMQGHADWNSLAASIHPRAISAQLDPFEDAHMQTSFGIKYGREGELRAHTGFALRYPLDGEGCEYVRVVDPCGREIAYWDHNEWRDDPKVVLGAIIGAIVRGVSSSPEACKGRAGRPALAEPLTIYTETYSAHADYLRTPDWVRFTLTQELLDQLLHLRDLIKEERLFTVTRLSGPDLWDGENDEDDPIRMEMDELVVTESNFYFSSRIKHTDAVVESVGIDFEPLLKAIAGDPDQKSEYLERHGNLMVWGNGGDLVIEAARDAGENVDAWPSEQPGQLLADHCPECQQYTSECICDEAL